MNYFMLCVCVRARVCCPDVTLSLSLPRVAISERLVLFVVFVLWNLINKWE